MDEDGAVPLSAVIDSYAVSAEATDYDELGPLITNTVAALTGQPPKQVGTALASCVDIDALDRLFSPPRDEHAPVSEAAQLQLRVAGCLVTVDPDGTVTVTPPDRQV